ncbi:MAG: RNA 2',3'-cyclic phosphodiesterase [Nanoarchaeota archaeon]|nr:RNA 2',3'-cyclic phosphodiesterase [Nanoarchaeota archaeon]
MARCFIAIAFPEEIKKEIIKIQKQLPEFKGKLTEKENLHLTLKFFGEISDEKLIEVKKTLKKFKFKKFRAKLGDLGLFCESFIRILWIKLENCDELQKEIDNSLKDLFKKEKRFMSHLTIGRVKSIRDKKLFINCMKKINVKPLEFEVNEIHFKESNLTPNGPIYSDILKIKLT